MDIENAEKLDLNLARQWLVKKIRDEYGEDSENAQNALVFLNRYSVMKEKLVHCKDCRFGVKRLDALRSECIECHRYSAWYSHNLDHFCADGERKGR